MKTLSITSIIAFVLVFLSCSKSDVNVSPTSADGSGQGGSMARFAIVNNTLYCVVPNQLQVYDISLPTDPVIKTPITLSMGLETIFPYKNNLFIGATDGMYIFDNSKPNNPTLLSRFTHVQSCDPVVVQDNYAYITLRAGTNCRQFPTQSTLDVVDISNLNNPRVVSSQTLQSPYGLGIDGTQLFVCEGDNGLKIFDVSKPTQPVLKQTMTNIKSFDVIPLNKILLVTGIGGLFQYDYSNTSKLDLLSKISIEN